MNLDQLINEAENSYINKNKKTLKEDTNVQVMKIGMIAALAAIAFGVNSCKDKVADKELKKLGCLENYKKYNIDGKGGFKKAVGIGDTQSKAMYAYVVSLAREQNISIDKAARKATEHFGKNLAKQIKGSFTNGFKGRITGVSVGKDSESGERVVRVDSEWQETRSTNDRTYTITKQGTVYIPMSEGNQYGMDDDGKSVKIGKHTFVFDEGKNMNLDQLINEAGYSYLNSFLGKEKDGEKGGKGFDLLSYENARQERIERQIEQARKDGDEKKVAELEKKLDKSDIGSETGKENKNKGTDDVAKLKNINALKGKICFLMMNYVNLTSGVGLNGDNSTTNAVKIVKGKDGEKKVVGAPSTSEITKHYNALKAAVEQLKKYEDGYEENGKYIYGAPKRYFESRLDRSKVLLKALENIGPDEIEFDADSVDVPISTNSTFVKTGEKTGRKNDDGTDEKYAEINKLKVGKKGEINSQVWKTKIAKVLGKKRFNPFVYEELQPYIHEFQKYRKDWDIVKHPENVDMDFVSKDVPNNLSQRKQKASEYANGKGKFSDFKKARKYEQSIGNISSAKDQKGEDGKIDNAAYSAKKYAGNLALRQSYAQSAEDGKTSKTGNQGWLEAHHIEKLNLTKIKKIINDWIEKKLEPSKDENRIIKFFGAMPGSGGSTGAGTLIFMHTDKPVDGQFKYDGLYAFKAGKSFMNGDLTSEQEKYVESHAGRKADEWKKGVIEALKKYDTEDNATVYTEEVNTSYFNY